MSFIDVEEDPDDIVESDDAKGECVTCYQASRCLDTHAYVYADGVAQNRNIIMHLLSQVRIGMDLSRVCTIGQYKQ